MTVNQLKMLDTIASHPVTINQALAFKQYTFGSLCKNKWVLFDAYTNTFYVSDRGLRAMEIEIRREKTQHWRFSRNAPERPKALAAAREE